MDDQSACERVGGLRGVTWRWRTDAPDGLFGADMGVLAQEVGAVCPGLIREAPNGHLVVDYGGLVVELLAAIVELDARAGTPPDGAALPTACELVARLAPGEPQHDGVRRLDPVRAGAVTPGAVRTDAEGRTHVAHHTLVAPLIEAVKELDARLAEEGR